MKKARSVGGGVIEIPDAKGDPCWHCKATGICQMPDGKPCATCPTPKCNNCLGTGWTTHLSEEMVAK